MAEPEHALTRTQDLPDAFYDAGQFYFGTSTSGVMAAISPCALPLLLPLPRLQTLDIDTEADLSLAELIAGCLAHK